MTRPPDTLPARLRAIAPDLPHRVGDVLCPGNLLHEAAAQIERTTALTPALPARLRAIAPDLPHRVGDALCPGNLLHEAAARLEQLPHLLDRPRPHGTTA